MDSLVVQLSELEPLCLYTFHIVGRIKMFSKSLAKCVPASDDATSLMKDLSIEFYAKEASSRQVCFKFFHHWAANPCR